jgi:anti-sigma factor RsiW
MLTHRRFRSEVHRLVDDALPAERVAALLAHLGLCDRCREDLFWWRSIRTSVRRDRTVRP